MKVKDLIDLIEKYFGELCNPEDEINNRLVFGDTEDEVEGILVCWKPTVDIIKKCIDEGYNVIICHEDLFYSYKAKYTVQRNLFEIESNRKKVELLVQGKINVIRFHTKWDDSPYGNNDTLLKVLDLESIMKFKCSRLAELRRPMKAYEFAKFVKEKLNSPFVLIAGNKNKIIRRILVVAGGGARLEFIDFAKSLRCDALLSGDLTADVISYAYENDIVVIDPGHQYLEQIGMKNLAKILKENLDNIPVKFVENSRMADILVG